MLLLSLGIGAVPGFIASSIGKAAAEVRIAYLNDAARPYEGMAFTADERARLAKLDVRIEDVTAAGFDGPDAFGAALENFDVLYAAGGNTFTLLSSLRRRGVEKALVERVRAGLPYIGTSAGAIVTGPSVEPASLMDDRTAAPECTDLRGLGLVNTVVVPHADGKLPPYPAELIEEITRRYGGEYPLTLINDDQALLVEDGSPQLISSP